MTTVIQFPERDTAPLSGRVSEEIRALMGRYGVSQVALSQWVGFDQAGLSQRLRGKTEWKVSEIERVAQAFGVHPATLMGGYATGPNLGPDGGVPVLRARRDSNPKPSDPKVLPLRVAA
jgi:sugar phosphate isomerase/epimerase